MLHLLSFTHFLYLVSLRKQRFMLSIIQDIPDFVLSSQLDIVIEADKQVTFSLYKAGNVILQETYTRIQITRYIFLICSHCWSRTCLKLHYAISHIHVVRPKKLLSARHS